MCCYKGGAGAPPPHTHSTHTHTGPECSTPFCRSVIFMLDRSGSMEGEPLAGAKAALVSGLRLLTRHDQFTVVAFDHEQLWWTGEFKL